MILKENPELTQSDYERISEIFELVEWGIRESNDIESTFAKSTFTCLIWENDTIVGFGRTFDDGKYYATICDVAIDPSYQGKGLGTQIVANLKSRLKGYLFITLTAAPGKGEFYQKLGWRKQTSAYIAPVSQQQTKEHT
ncbi:MAG: GNAT superfamily N-acetyltransferase [Salibacteraceae bacterium]|jgi:GNAT superfamily N-acetyltransferase